MPEGVKGFQPGRPKTGGRKKETVQRVKPLIDLLKDNGFNFAKELARALHELPESGLATSTKYAELMRLLPYMAPRLNERAVDVVDPTTETLPAAKPISDDDLMKALGNGKSKQSAGSSGSVAPGNSRLEIPRRSEVDLQNVVGEQKAD